MATPPQASIIHQLTVRIATDKLTKFGKPKPQRRRFDALAVVKPYFSAYQGDLITFGIEIKVAKGDLKSDEKYIESLHFTDYYIFVISNNLIKTALEKLNNTNIGILNFSTGEVIKLPVIQKVSLANRLAVFCEFAARQNFSKANNFKIC